MKYQITKKIYRLVFGLGCWWAFIPYDGDWSQPKPDSCLCWSVVVFSLLSDLLEEMLSCETDTSANLKRLKLSRLHVFLSCLLQVKMQCFPCFCHMHECLMCIWLFLCILKVSIIVYKCSLAIKFM